MKWFFVGSALLGVALYVTALATLPPVPDDGKTRMRWATDANPARTNQLSKFSTMFPDLVVTVDPGLGADQTKLFVQCATGTGPDIIDVYDINQMMALVEAGILLDLTPYVKEYGFGPENTFPAVQDALFVDGKQYRFPCNIATSNLLFNRAVFDKYGLPYPSDDVTFEELIRMGRGLRQAAEAKGERVIPLPDINIMDLLIAYGGNLFSEDGLYSELDSEQAIKAMQMRYDLMLVHRVIPPPTESSALSSQGGWGGNNVTWFSQGRAAMLLIGRWYSVQLPEYPGMLENLGVTGVPRVQGLQRMTKIDTRAAGINVKSKNWKKALRFLQYLASPTYSKIIIEDGDGLPPNPAVAQNGQMMVNQLLPDAKMQQAFLDAAIGARPINTSMYIDNGMVQRWIWEAQGYVDSKIKTPEKAMRDVANEVNNTIRTNLERRPDLQARFERMTGKKWTKDWHKSTQPHQRLPIAGLLQ